MGIINKYYFQYVYLLNIRRRKTVVLLYWWHRKPHGGRLTKAFDVTIASYRRSQTKIKSVKCIFDVWVQNFMRNFKGTIWNFIKNLHLYTAKYAFDEVLQIWRIRSYDILNLSETGPRTSITMAFILVSIHDSSRSTITGSFLGFQI